MRGNTYLVLQLRVLDSWAKIEPTMAARKKSVFTRMMISRIGWFLKRDF
jgi:hypothetical protein